MERPPGGARPEDHTIIRRELDLGESTPIEYIDEGWDSRVYLVGGGVAVFKFPRFEQARAQYEHETAVLDLLERNSPDAAGGVRTPRVRWRATDLSWFGYEGIVGTSFAEALPALPGKRKDAIGAALGSFLRALHGADVPGLPVFDIEREIDDYRHKYDLARATLREKLTDAEFAQLERFAREELPSSLRRLGGDLCVAHGDLGPWNIILAVDGEVGVIDFGDTGRHDRSKDFMGFGDARILASAFESYGADARLREKALLRASALPVLDLPFFIGTSNTIGVDRYVSQIRRTLAEGGFGGDGSGIRR